MTSLEKPLATEPARTNSSLNGRLPLCGRVLCLVRILWVVLALLSLGLFVLAIESHIIYTSSNLPLGTRVALIREGIPTYFYIAFLLVQDILVVFGYAVTGFAIFRSRSDDWITLFVSLSLITFGVTIASIESPTSPLASLGLYHPGFKLPVALLQSVGLGMFLLVFYLFPNGLFVPRWTKPMAVIWLVWLVAWTVFNSQNLEAVSVSPAAKFVLRMLMTDVSQLHAIGYNLRIISLGFVLLIWFGSGVVAQIYRYVRVSAPLQRHQTKFAVLGMVVTAVMYFAIRMAPPMIFPYLRTPGVASLRYELIALPLGTLALLFIPVTFNISMLRYRLWDVDYLINRTLVYASISIAVILFYVIDVLVVQHIFSSLAGNQSTIFVVLSTLALAAAFTPLRRWLQSFVDRKFFRQTVNFRQVFTSFAREIRTILDLDRLLRTLVNRTTQILYVDYSAVYLLDDRQQLQIKESRNLPAAAPAEWQLKPDQLNRLRGGQVISQARDPLFPLLAPLLSPQTSGQNPGEAGAASQSTSLLGILALGPRCSGLPYSREDQALLLSLADQAGTAIYVARLIQEMQQETERRMEAEQRLESYHSSPLGQAEALAQDLTSAPDTALKVIHQLAQKAGKEPDCASLIGNLPQALEDRDSGMLGSLAEGFNYLYQGQFTPALVPIGLRSIIVALSAMVRSLELQPEALQEMECALRLYRLCLQAYDANTIPQIMDFEAVGEYKGGAPADDCVSAYPEYLAGLFNVLKEMHPVAEALHASERVDTPADKLAYLASAVNNLRHMDHLASDLGSSDQPVIEQIASSWLATVTTAMSELQTSARLVCRLLTRNTWTGDVVSLALSIQNLGRGAALQLKVSLVPGPEYTLIDEVALLERLAPGEEAEVNLRVRPRLNATMDHFRARFVILYTDPRGPDQVENFADVVHLLATGGEFQFIPNPYVVGTPLKTGSPLFYGREDVVKFIQSNLSASHRNNLVLIGQRRTGKTSLLKQLPQRLSDDTLPVYLDGQTLGLDPGMPNFFLSLATEIAFALEDRGFEITPPELENFQASPFNTFEKDFLATVRAQIGDRHLLIMFDEFEELETAVKRGDLEPTIFGFLRHLIQHQPDLSVIFCGTHRLEQLASDYWNILFNISLYQHIAYLSKEEALHLIQEPVASFGMAYDDLALDKIWRITAGHPYFLQLLCHSLVNQHNKTGRSYVTIADVNAALDEILASGEAHFVYMWTESSATERLVLTALSRLIPLTGQISALQVIDFFEERGLTLERQAVNAAIHQLMLRDILQSSGDMEAAAGESFRWKLGLLGLWVEKYKSLSRVMNEVMV